MNQGLIVVNLWGRPTPSQSTTMSKQQWYRWRKKNTGQGVKRSRISNPVTEGKLISPLWVSFFPSVEERVWSRWRLKGFLSLCSGNSVRPLTSDRARLLLLSTHSLLFIHLIIMWSCQEGEHPSKELLKFYSEFYKFLFPAFGPQIRLYVSYSHSEVGGDEQRAKEKCEHTSRVDEMRVTAQCHKKGQSRRYRGQNYRLGRSKQTLE